MYIVSSNNKVAWDQSCPLSTPCITNLNEQPVVKCLHNKECYSLSGKQKLLMLSPYGIINSRYHLTNTLKSRYLLTNSIRKHDILTNSSMQCTYQCTLSHLIPSNKNHLADFAKAFWLHSMPFKLHVEVKTFIARDALVRPNFLMLLTVTS